MNQPQSKHRPLGVALAAALVSTAGCATSAGPPPEDTGPKPYVNRIELSRTMGEVGRPFEADIAIHSRHLLETEYDLSSLPPGLSYDVEKNAIVGVPERAGFFNVTVAVRKARGKGVHFNTVEGAWFTEEFELAIYQPVEDTAELDDFGVTPEDDADEVADIDL